VAVILYRLAYFGYYPLIGRNWYTWANLQGVTIHQWALEVPDGKGGYQEISQLALPVFRGGDPQMSP
jgi:hypothetical protein